MNSRFRQVSLAKDVVVQVIGGDALMLNLRDETVFSLNATGARIAQLIASGMSSEAITEDLCRDYGADRAEVARDVDDLIGALVSKGLVVAEAGGGER